MRPWGLTMIGTFIFFGLYPLTRFINRVSEAVKSRYPPVLMNGGRVWDDEGVQTRRFTNTPSRVTSQLDLRISEPVKDKTETRDKLTEGEPGIEEKDGIKGTERHGIKGEDKPFKAEKEESREERVTKQKDADMIRGQKERDRDKVSHHQMKDKTVFSGRLDTVEETGLGSLVEETDNRQQTQESSIKTSDITNDDPNQSVTDRTTEGGGRSVFNWQDDVLPTQNKCQVQVVEGETQTRGVAVEEHWDEYVDAWYSGSCSSGRDLQSSASPGQPELAGWHFPVGLGLGEVMYCPAWHIPAMSYYPPEATPFEVMWRVWEEVEEEVKEEEVKEAVFDFTVMSYNILAQDLLETNQQLYSHCPLEVLQWEYRLQKLLLEIQGWQADILCLQEVQENHYELYLQPALTDMGYTCVFKRRTGTKTDGCAVCYRSDRFSQQCVSLLEFLRPQCPLLDRDNVAVVLLLQPVITKGSEVSAKGPPLCVANTHLLFNPSRGDVKLAQLAVLLAEMQRVAEGCQAAGNPCHVILCGDFNSVPNMPLYQLITRGQLHYQGLPAWMVSGQKDMSYKAHQHRLYAPLWPPSLGVTDHCQYSSGPSTAEQPGAEQPGAEQPGAEQPGAEQPGAEQPGAEQPSLEAGGVSYSHDFLLQLRFCDAAFVRPLNLDMIPGVTDNTPDPEVKHQLSSSSRFRNTIDHSLTLRSVYRHVLPGSDRPEVTTVHSDVGATVDYIFYSAGYNRRGRGRPGEGRPGEGRPGEGRPGEGRPAGGLKLVRRLSLLSEEDLWSMNGLPNHIFPSDHLSLLARFHLEVPPESPGKVPPGSST